MSQNTCPNCLRNASKELGQMVWCEIQRHWAVWTFKKNIPACTWSASTRHCCQETQVVVLSVWHTPKTLVAINCVLNPRHQVWKVGTSDKHTAEAVAWNTTLIKFRLTLWTWQVEITNHRARGRVQMHQSKARHDPNWIRGCSHLNSGPPGSSRMEGDSIRSCSECKVCASLQRCGWTSTAWEGKVRTHPYNSSVAQSNISAEETASRRRSQETGGGRATCQSCLNDQAGEMDQLGGPGEEKAQLAGHLGDGVLSSEPHTTCYPPPKSERVVWRRSRLFPVSSTCIPKALSIRVYYKPHQRVLYLAA